MFSIYIVILYLALFAYKPTRKIALVLTPWAIFGCSYDCMRLLPNYEVNPIDIRELYETEKKWFGIVTAAGTVTPNEFFALHHHAVADLWAGFFYLCWVPVPIGFSIYLYIRGDYKNYLRFSTAFLLINFVGFAGYYIHPAAPPWYVMQYGFEPILHTPGNVAGLGRFDQLTGIPVFQALYGKNSNVFAAVPSLHAAYMLVTTIYAIISKQHKTTIGIFAIICVGIWFTAIYSGHHYVIDVLLGILTCFVGIGILEFVLLKIPTVQQFMKQYVQLISMGHRTKRIK